MVPNVVLGKVFPSNLLLASLANLVGSLGGFTALKSFQPLVNLRQCSIGNVVDTGRSHFYARDEW